MSKYETNWFPGQAPNDRKVFWTFEFGNFGFVSDFGFCASNLTSVLSVAIN
jgi:hypothetical protein